MPKAIPVDFSEPFRRTQLYNLPQCLGSPEFLKACQWDRASGTAELVVRGSVGRTEPLNCVLVGVVTSDRPALGPQGTFNPKYDTSSTSAKKAKFQFTLARPSEVTEPLFAADWDIALQKILSLQQQVGTSSKNDHRHFVITEHVKQQNPTYTLRFNYPIFEQKKDVSKVKDESLIEIIQEKEKVSAAYNVASDYTEMFDLLKETHWAVPMPVFVPESVDAIAPEDFADRLVGSLVEVTFHLQHFRYGSAEYDTFSAKVQHVTILRNPEVGGRVQVTSPLRRKPVHVPQTPTRREQVSAAKAFVPSPVPRIPAPVFTQGASGASEHQTDAKKRAEGTGTGSPSSSNTLSSNGHESRQAKDDVANGSPTKRAKRTHGEFLE